MLKQVDDEINSY